MIVVLSGPGGVGKGTIASLLVDADPQLWLSRSWTTRAQRPGEPDEAYVFVTRDEFEARIAEDGFLEWAEFLGELYGTPWPAEQPGRDVVLEIDVQGARSVRAKGIEALLLFVDAPSRVEQAERLRNRGDHADSIAARIHAADLEAALAEELGMTQVINDELSDTVHRILDIIGAARVAAGADHNGG